MAPKSTFVLSVSPFWPKMPLGCFSFGAQTVMVSNGPFKDSWWIPLKTREFLTKVNEIFASGMPLTVVPQGDFFATKTLLVKLYHG